MSLPLRTRGFEAASARSAPRSGIIVGAKRSLSRGNAMSRGQKKKKHKPSDDKLVGTEAGLINWYPGHIAKAERVLQSQLKLVDIVIEVRDLRAAVSTSHPKVDSWAGNKPRVVVYTFVDAVPTRAIEDWQKFTVNGLFVDAKRRGGDLRALKSAVRDAGRTVNEKRVAKGVRPRPARAAIIGFPNVGKSALINCLCGRRAAKAENRAGVTRQLNWVKARDDNSFELLDSPGIIPAKQLDQRAAAKLAFCGDIGAASYDPSLVAAALVGCLQHLPTHYAPHAMERLQQRSGINIDQSGDARDWLEDFAQCRYSGDVITAANVVLADFRNGRLGPVALEQPPFTLKEHAAAEIMEKPAGAVVRATRPSF